MRRVDQHGWSYDPIMDMTLKMGIMANWTGWGLASNGSPDKQQFFQKLQGPPWGPLRVLQGEILWSCRARGACTQEMFSAE